MWKKLILSVLLLGNMVALHAKIFESYDRKIETKIHYLRGLIDGKILVCCPKLCGTRVFLGSRLDYCQKLSGAKQCKSCLDELEEFVKQGIEIKKRGFFSLGCHKIKPKYESTWKKWHQEMNWPRLTGNK